MKEVHGANQGLKKSIRLELANLYNLAVPQEQLWSLELVEKVSYLSSLINKEIALYLDRQGRVVDVSIGNHRSVTLAQVEGKRNPQRLAGIRCLHTHPNGSGNLSAIDINTLKKLRLDAMIAVGIKGEQAQELFTGIIDPEQPEEVKIFGPDRPDKTDFSDLNRLIEQADRQLRRISEDNKSPQERAILVGINSIGSGGSSEAEIALAELEELAKTAGAQVIGKIIQKQSSLNSTTVITQGKLEELQFMVQASNANLVIMEAELSGTQQRNLEEALGCKVLSRTALILDIFAQRARSKEGKLQVELAQLEYMLPRLSGTGTALSRLGGGIGTRGPGETKLETNRRHIRARISHLKRELAAISKQRNTLRQNRQKNDIPLVSLVGYTNAGKSTLLNTLCSTQVLAEDKLFATLDTTIRRLPLPSGRTVLMADTVGFIRRLPPGLLAAFKSTLEEVVLADLILIVADASDPQVEDQIRIVDEILIELKAEDKPTLIALNKIDRLATKNPLSLSLPGNRKVIEISALTGQGLELLKETIENILFGRRIRVKLLIPYDKGKILALLHNHSKVLQETYTEQGVLLEVEMEKSQLKGFAEYRVYNSGLQ
ncbi:MAG: GTPase HflX [Peptococcaceae bacterium]|nr:GTPase HflX [Peptococcaceae bacterium]